MLTACCSMSMHGGGIKSVVAFMCFMFAADRVWLWRLTCGVNNQGTVNPQSSTVVCVNVEGIVIRAWGKHIAEQQGCPVVEICQLHKMHQ